MSSSLNSMSKKVLIACSGGPDSMALLDMMKDKYEVYVAHVNYHHRDSALRDEDIVRNYCLKYQIPFFKKDYVEKQKGNFQDKARIFRYKFFKEIVDKYQLECVFTAHHKDDLIETYLMQIEKKIDVSYYGLNKKVNLYGVVVKRPLLKYTKKELENYCLKNNIEFGIDESNLTDFYTRNKIRHEIIDKLTIRQKNEYVKTINIVNRKLKEEREDVKKYINKRTKLSIEEFNNYENKLLLLRTFIGKNISKKYGEEIIRQVENVNSFEILLDDKYLCKEYGYLEVYLKEDDYSYILDRIQYFKTKHFKLSKKGNNKEGVTLDANDFPLTIRNYQNGDFIKMRYGKKKLSRFFIDNKISSKERKMWPLMLNKNNEVVLVPNIGCNKYHYSAKHNIYMIKF